MKKIYLTFLLTLIFLLTSCGKTTRVTIPVEKIINGLEDLSVEEISKIEIHQYSAGTSPGALSSLLRITNTGDIISVYNYLHQHAEEVSSEILIGGRNEVYDIYSNGKLVLSFCVYANEIIIDDKRYRLLTEFPELSSEIKTYNIFSNKLTDVEVFNKSDEFICKLDNLNKFVFERKEFYPGTLTYQYYFSCMGVVAYVIEKDIIIYQNIFYKIVSDDNFDFLFEEGIQK